MSSSIKQHILMGPTLLTTAASDYLNTVSWQTSQTSATINLMNYSQFQTEIFISINFMSRCSCLQSYIFPRASEQCQLYTQLRSAPRKAVQCLLVALMMIVLSVYSAVILCTLYTPCHRVQILYSQHNRRITTMFSICLQNNLILIHRTIPISKCDCF